MEKGTMINFSDKNGNTYTVRTRTGLDVDMFYPHLISVWRKLAPVFKLDANDTENIPPSVNKLVSMFVQWLQVTEISGNVGYQTDLLMVTANDFKAWYQSIQQDSELYTAWKNAVAEVDKTAQSPLVPSAAETNEGI